jgi:hypothetical protein
MNKNVRKTRIRKVVRKKQDRREVNEGTARNYRIKKASKSKEQREKGNLIDC